MNSIIDFKYLDVGKDELNNLKHSHGQSYEILLVRSGSGKVVIKDKLFLLRPGAIYFINGLETHCTVPDNQEEYYRGKIIVASQYIDKIAEITNCRGLTEELFHKNGGTCYIPAEKEMNYIDAEFAAINKAIISGSVYAEASIAASIINIMYSGYMRQKKDIMVTDSRVSSVLEYIEEKLTQKISLEDICKHTHISKYYLCHQFKREVGMTAFEYILSRRLSMARKYLINTDMSLSEISENTGFSSFSYFSKTFREYEGITPSEFRKRNR